MQDKIRHAKGLIKEAVDEYGDQVAVACSWGKDSMVLLHLALQVKPDIPVFSILTIHKPKETFDFVAEVVKKYEMNLRIYMVNDSVPPVLQQNNVEVTLLPPDEYRKNAAIIKSETGREIYDEDPNLCCQLLKIIPARYAYRDMNLKAWIAGLRNTEGHTRLFLSEKETRSQKEAKFNPILAWVENEVWKYTEDNDVPVHPWYKKEFPNGKHIRSLGCEPCTVPIYDYESERDGRWRHTYKRAGECGIHTQPLRKLQKDEV